MKTNNTENKNLYALLVGVGNYTELDAVNLPTYKTDLSLFGTALLTGLNAHKDNIRLMAGENNNGYIKVSDLAKAITGFRNLLTREDTFFFYFSGHGSSKKLVFSDGQIELQSIIEFIDRLPAKNKILVLDCCYSGNFHTNGAKEMNFEEAVSEFAGHGIAVMASSAANEISRLGADGTHSVFTGVLSTAIAMKKRMKKGCLSLTDINEEMQFLMKNWNEKNPGKEQHPVFRSSMGGTIYFPVEEYKPYKPKEISWETKDYKVVKVDPLSSNNMKRLCAFVIPVGTGRIEELPKYTKEIARKIRYEKIYSTKMSEERFGSSPARAVWCYFGHDESDIINHLHYVYTIWTADKEARELFFKSNKHAIVLEDIYIYQNASYEMLKKMHSNKVDRETFITDNKKLLAAIVTKAEQFITDLQEVANRTLDIEKMKEKYGQWIYEVRKIYLEISDGEIAPDDLHDWTEEIMSLAGWILDLSLLLENEKNDGIIGDREMWLIKNAIGRYQESLERLKQLEKIFSRIFTDCVGNVVELINFT